MPRYPYISPFRYPGGKTWLVPFFHEWARLGKREVLVEPFAGGASISLSCLEAAICERAILVELDPNIAAVWKTILGPDWRLLSERILAFVPSPNLLEQELAPTAVSTWERAWQTILLNRMNHGGITAFGSGRLRNGERGRGLGSRWYPETLVRRIERIRFLRRRITFIQGDGIQILEADSDCRTSLYFIDPPYPKAGRRLYDHWQVNHPGLFRIMGDLSGRFLATYPHNSEIEAMAMNHKLHVRSTTMFSRLHRKKQELLISNRVFPS